MADLSAGPGLVGRKKVKDSCDSARRWPWKALYSESVLASLALEERTHESI